jgi:hypothetical protein
LIAVDGETKFRYITTANYRLTTVYYRLTTVYYRLTTVYYRLTTVYYRLTTTKFLQLKYAIFSSRQQVKIKDQNVFINFFIYNKK